MSTADKLNKLLETKQAIKQAIIDKGVDVSDNTVFAEYPAKINAIEGANDIDLSNYVTKDELPPIRVIGSDNPDEPYVLTGNEFTDEEYEIDTYHQVILKNVEIDGWSYPNDLCMINVYETSDNGEVTRYIDVYDQWGSQVYNTIDSDGNVVYDSDDNFVWQSNLDNYATKGYVDNAISNIEIPEVDLNNKQLGYNKENAAIINNLHVTEKETVISSAGFGTNDNATYQLVIDIDGGKYRIDSSSITQSTFGKVIKFTDSGELGIQAQINVGVCRINNKVVIDPYRAMLTINSSIPEEGHVISLVAYNSTQPYVTEDVLAYAINNLDIPEVDTSNLATKEELNDAISNIEISGGSGCALKVIGDVNSEEPHILTGDEFTDEEIENQYIPVLFRNVKIADLDVSGLCDVRFFGRDAIYIYSPRLGFHECFKDGDTGEWYEAFGYYYATDSELEEVRCNYATKEELNNALGDIESLLGNI